MKRTIAGKESLFWIIVFVMIIAIPVVFFIAFKPSKNTVVYKAGTYRVVEVYDGDTFSVDMNGKAEKVRLIGVDTPETHKPNTPVQCYGPEASKYTKKLLTGKSVKLESDTKSTNRDRYDRLLRYAYLEDGTLLNKDLIDRGFGFAYLSFPFDKSKEFRQTEDNARSQKYGLWQKCNATLNKGLYQTNPIGS